MPKISVIIPVYKVEQFIERCAISLFEQTLDDIEYLFIDDCSPDNSVEIIKNVLMRYETRKDSVRIISMQKNCGQAAVRKVHEAGVYQHHGLGIHRLQLLADDFMQLG